MRRLRTVGAIFRTASRLYAEQDAALNLIALVILPVCGLGVEDQLGKRKVIDAFNLSDTPIVPQVRICHRAGNYTAADKIRGIKQRPTLELRVTAGRACGKPEALRLATARALIPDQLCRYKFLVAVAFSKAA